MNFPQGLMKDTSITLLSRCLHAIIVSLHKTPKGCYAGNEWFAGEIGVVANTISKHMKELSDKKYIERETRPRRYGGRDRYIIPLKYTNIPNRIAEGMQTGNSKVTTSQSECDVEDIPIYDSSNRKSNNSSRDITFSPELFIEMEKEYPLKDIHQAKTSFYSKSKNLNADNIESRFRKWCDDEFESPQKLQEQFKRDSCGYPMAYCEKCGVSASYEENEISGDSKCCQAKLLPTKRKRNSHTGDSRFARGQVILAE